MGQKTDGNGTMGRKPQFCHWLVMLSWVTHRSSFFSILLHDPDDSHSLSFPICSCLTETIKSNDYKPRLWCQISHESNICHFSPVKPWVKWCSSSEFQFYSCPVGLITVPITHGMNSPFTCMGLKISYEIWMQSLLYQINTRSILLQYWQKTCSVSQNTLL